jgi:hypothetical protein
MVETCRNDEAREMYHHQMVVVAIACASLRTSQLLRVMWHSTAKAVDFVLGRGIIVQVPRFWWLQSNICQLLPRDPKFEFFGLVLCDNGSSGSRRRWLRELRQGI